MNTKFYTAPKLPFDFTDLEPYISSEQLKLHYHKHHQKYVDTANELLANLDASREEHTDLDVAHLFNQLTFNVGGAILHSLFWHNLMSSKEGGGGKPRKMLEDAIKKEFGSFERFKEEFIKVALNIEGSGWAALAYDKVTNRILIMPIEKHNLNVYPSLNILLVLDVWEHAYYLDYKNDRSKYINAFWKIVNWEAVKKRLELAVTQIEI